MMETSLRTGVVQKIMNGEETKFLPQCVIDMMRASIPLQELVRAVAKNGSSAYADADGSDEVGKDDANLAQSGDQARCAQPISDELLVAFEDALSETPAGNKKAKTGDWASVSVDVKIPMKLCASFDIRVHNQTLRIKAGVFFGLLSEDREKCREYACVTECFSHNKLEFVRLELYKKTAQFAKKVNVSPKVRGLNLPGLKRYHPERRYSIAMLLG